MMSGLDGSGAVHTVLPWETFGGHVPSGGSEMYWFDQSIRIHPSWGSQTIEVRNVKLESDNKDKKGSVGFLPGHLFLLCYSPA